MNRYIVEFTMTGEGMIIAKNEEEAHDVVRKSLEKSAATIGEELAEAAELVHICAKHLHTLRVTKDIEEPAGDAEEPAGDAEEPAGDAEEEQRGPLDTCPEC